MSEVRDAADSDAKRISDLARPYGFGDEEEFKRDIASPDAVWVVDDDGGFCQIERKKDFTTISVGPLLPLDMGDDKAMALLKECMAGAYRKFPDERDWGIVTYIPAENRHAADSFEAWFRADRQDLRGGAVALTLPTMRLAYERSQRWVTL